MLFCKSPLSLDTVEGEEEAKQKKRKKKQKKKRVGKRIFFPSSSGGRSHPHFPTFLCSHGFPRWLFLLFHSTGFSPVSSSFSFVPRHHQQPTANQQLVPDDD
jgi:hypothetical protein